MGYSIRFGDDKGEFHEGGDVATNSAWANFVAWAGEELGDGFLAVRQLCEYGHTFDTGGLAAQLRLALDKSDPPPDVHETGEVILDALAEPPIDGPVGVFISDGTE